MTTDRTIGLSRRAVLAGAGGLVLAASGALGQQVFREIHEFSRASSPGIPSASPPGRSP